MDDNTGQAPAPVRPHGLIAEIGNFNLGRLHLTSRLPTAVGFIGLGLMGYPMAKQLVDKLSSSAKIYVYDVSQSVLDQFAQEGGVRVVKCASAKEVAEESGVIITMVPEGSHVQAVYLDSKLGVLCADISGKIIIDCSTIDVPTSTSVAKEIEDINTTHGNAKSPAFFCDAPVSGGVLGAEAASLTFMVGCAESSPYAASVKALLELMGAHIFFCGAQSLGLTAKLSNNYLSGIVAIATSEAFNIAMRAGMDPKVLQNIFSTSTAQSAINDKWNPVPGLCPEAPSSNGYKGGFRIELMRKDFDLAVQTAESVGARLALGEQALDVYTKAMEDENCKGLDSRVVYRYLGGKEPGNEHPTSQ